MDGDMGIGFAITFLITAAVSGWIIAVILGVLILVGVL
jgi:hypothetical protein